MTQFRWDPRQHLLGVESIDSTHQDFLALAGALEGASSADFPRLFDEFVRHTAEHFAGEERLMRDSACPTLAEHAAEHRRVLADLERFLRSLQRGRSAMARAFVRDSLREWFENHLASMDSALAMHLLAEPPARP